MSEKTCVIYARYSSHNQNDASIEQQVAECREYAKREGLTVAKVYADRAISGTTDSRPQFQQMIKDSSKKQWSIVLVWKYDRFARDRYDSANYKFRLKQNGVRLVSAKEPLPSGPEAILLESILEGSAEYYSANLAQNVKRGMRYTVEHGKAYGRRPYGYRQGSAGWEKDPEEANIVAEIFTRYAGGEGANTIAKSLNKRKVPSCRGALWRDSTIRQIMKNRKYIGEWLLNGEIMGRTEPIVTRELFDAANSRRQHIERRQQADGTIYALTGKIRCGLCGGGIVGKSTVPRPGEKYLYYVCRRQTNLKECTLKPVRKEKLERQIGELLQEYILAPEIAAQIAEAASRAADAESSASVLQGLKEQQKETKAAIQNILKAIEAGAWSKSLNERLASLEEDERAIEAAIAEETAAPLLSKEDVLLYLSQAGPGNLNDPVYLRNLLDALVEKVTVWPDKFEVRVRFFDDVITHTLSSPHKTVVYANQESGVSVVLFGLELMLEASREHL